MRSLRWIAVAALAALVWGCAADVGAGEAPTPTQVQQGAPFELVPTATPKPKFGPPTVSPGALTATALADPLSPTIAPAPGDITPTPDVSGTPTATPTAGPTATSTPLPLVLFAPVEPGEFSSPLEYDLTVPDGWIVSVGVDQISIVHSDGLLKVTLRELPVDREIFVNFAGITQSTHPSPRSDWTAWSISNSRPIDGGGGYEYVYTGTRNGRDHVSVIRWQLWGEILIEAAIEANANVWATDSKLRNEAELIVSTLLEVDTDEVSEVDALRQKLKARFGFFRSGIYQVDQQGYRQELSCRNVFLQLLTDPVYIGDGVWQVHAIGDQGAQVWLMYEPTGTIVPVISNTSKC